MIPAKSRGYGPFGGLRVERETKPDGRYILYYSWPDGPRDAGRAPKRPGRREPWTPESGPPDKLTTSPRIPPLLQREVASAAGLRSETGRCLWCDLLEQELRDGRRIVIETDSWIGSVPFAARWP